MSAALACTPKLAKLITLLASDKDGEVLGAARAIGRTLAAAGTDWHDLAKALTEPPPENASDPDAELPFILRCLHNHPSLDKQRAAVLRIWERLQ